jgi:hypothetical protein
MFYLSAWPIEMRLVYTAGKNVGKRLQDGTGQQRTKEADQYPS